MFVFTAFNKYCFLVSHFVLAYWSVLTVTKLIAAVQSYKNVNERKLMDFFDDLPGIVHKSIRSRYEF